MALFRLRLNLALEFRKSAEDEDFALPYQPSEAWTSRLRGERIRVNPDHRDFPALLAEVLDLMAVHEDDVAKVAACFSVSSSQLIKFLALEPRALHALNERRRAQGQRVYRA